jgi:hypothetical protein
MTATARLTLVVAMLVALVDGSLNLGPASAEDNCLAAPNAPALQGSHWHYRTDPVRKIKCWYLRPEGQAIQKPAAQEKPQTDVATGSTAPTPKTAPNQLGSEPMELHPAQAVLPAPAENRQAGTHGVAWPDPPSPVRAEKVTWPDPPSPAAPEKAAWPDPPSPAGADKVPSPDPGSPTGAEKAAWPDPPLPARSATPEVASQKPPAAASTPQEKSRQTHETFGNEEVLISTLLAVAAGLVFLGIIARWIVKMAFARRPSVHSDLAREPTIPRFVAQGRPHELVDGDILEDGTKEALRKLLLILERQA